MLLFLLNKTTFELLALRWRIVFTRKKIKINKKFKFSLMLHFKMTCLSPIYSSAERISVNWPMLDKKSRIYVPLILLTVLAASEEAQHGIFSIILLNRTICISLVRIMWFRSNMGQPKWFSTSNLMLEHRALVQSLHKNASEWKPLFSNGFKEIHQKKTDLLKCNTAELWSVNWHPPRDRWMDLVFGINV